MPTVLYHIAEKSNLLRIKICQALEVCQTVSFWTQAKGYYNSKGIFVLFICRGPLCIEKFPNFRYFDIRLSKTKSNILFFLMTTDFKTKRDSK